MAKLLPSGKPSRFDVQPEVKVNDFMVPTRTEPWRVGDHAWYMDGSVRVAKCVVTGLPTASSQGSKCWVQMLAVDPLSNGAYWFTAGWQYYVPIENLSFTSAQYPIESVSTVVKVLTVFTRL